LWCVLGDTGARTHARWFTRSGGVWLEMPHISYTLEDQSGGAWLVKSDMSYALKEVVVLRTLRRWSTRTCQIVYSEWWYVVEVGGHIARPQDSKWWYVVR
jgi:hypothetical protein